VVDVTVIGAGPAARTCVEVLTRAGFRLNHTLELDSRDRSPVIIGEVQTAFAVAREAIESGRHTLIAGPQSLSPERLSLLLESRKRSQALFVWSERRYHPGYRFVSGLIEADATWRPRYLRQETVTLEPTTSAMVRWRMLEALSLAVGIAADLPLQVAAWTADNAVRNAADLICLNLAFHDVDAFIQVGLGEAVERRETLVAATHRKAFVDELNQTMPVRIVEDESHLRPTNAARWLSTASPSPDELARQQCLSFLEATLKTSLAQDEANVWHRSLAVLDAMGRSLSNRGAHVEVAVREEKPHFRLIVGQSLATPPSVA
jgi:hypothetical protein